ncbi:MAG: NifB/NifX family molybdenum-iron cluster-binding protein [Pseudomonadota bacterium]
MKLCFPSQQAGGIDGTPHGHFGSAPHFLIHDTLTGATVEVTNTRAIHEHGQCNPAGALAGHDVDGVIVGGIGMNALMKLNQQGIRVYRAVDGTIRENIAAAERGELREVAPAGSCGRHGGGGGGGSCHH